MYVYASPLLSFLSLCCPLSLTLSVVNRNVTEKPKSDNDKNKMTFKEALMGVKIEALKEALMGVKIEALLWIRKMQDERDDLN